MFPPHIIKKVKLKPNSLTGTRRNRFSQGIARPIKRPHATTIHFPSAPCLGSCGKRTQKQLYQFILSPGLIIGHTQRKFPASMGSHLPLHRISVQSALSRFFYHTAFGIKLQVNFRLFQNFVDFVRFLSPSGTFMTILTRENAVLSALEGYALEQV